MFKRLMKMKEDKKGFTLAELLIVVAIIGVLVAVSIPIFTAQLGKAKRATNQANARAAYAAASAAYLGDDTVVGGTYTIADGKFTADTAPTLPSPSIDYTKTTASTFGVSIGTDGTVTVTPKDKGTGATYNSGS